MSGSSVPSTPPRSPPATTSPAHTGRRDASVDAIAIYEPLLANYARILDAAHPYTLGTRRALADAYRAAGRDADAAALEGARPPGDAR